MKATLSILLFVVIATASVNGGLPTFSRHFHQIKTPFLLKEARKDCTTDPNTKFCTDDCSGIVTCKGSTPIITNCAKQSSNKNPYCNENTLACDSSPDYCQTNSETGKCEFVGLQPDLLNCKKYYDCETVGQDKYIYNCDLNTVYDPSTEKCALSKPCYDFSNKGLCKGKEDTVIVHPANKKFFIYCTSSNPILDKCPGSVNKTTDVYEYNPLTANCEYVCKQEGSFKNLYSTDCKSYYECIKGGSGFLRSLKNCPANLKFDEKAQKCTANGGDGCTSGGGGGSGF